MMSLVGIARAGAVMLALCAASLAQAQPYPNRPIRWIVPFPPGGPADVVARVVAQKLGDRVGQPAILDNRAGVGGNTGHEAAAKAPPDGYTVLFVVPSILTNVFQFKAAIDPFKELVPVIYLDSASLVLVASNAFGVKTPAEVIERIRANPGAVSCGSSGALPTVGCEMLRAYVKTDMIMVQYKGNAAALNALMGGEINLLFDVVNTSAGPIRGGRIRGIGHTNATYGLPILAELPKLAATIPDFNLVSWQGVMAPRGTPPETVQRLNAELNGVLQDPESRKRFADSGLEPTGGPPEVFDRLLKNDFEHLGRILRAAGMKPE